MLSTGRRLTRSLAALVLVCIVGVLAAVTWLGLWRRPQRAGIASVAGLGAAVTVRFDRWAVPHLSGGSSRDLAAALGYLHASERFAQMELGRRAAAGRLAELFGPAFVARDQYFRALRLYRVAEQGVEHAGPQTRELLAAYAGGVNAWLDRNRGALPPDLRLLQLLGDPFEPWRPADSLAFASLLAYSLTFPGGIAEEQRFAWLRALGPAATRDLIGPPAAEIPTEVLDLARRLPAPGGAGPASGRAPGPAGTPGSNAWALGRSRTASGRPLVANDTHLGLGLPGTWYEATLRAPDYEVAGMTLPGLPVVIVGQSRWLAWGLTNAMLDACDLYLEELDASGRRVRRAAGWLPVRESLGTIRVRGAASVTSRLRETDLGPLLAAEPEKGLPARTLVWTLYQPGDPVMALFQLGRAHTLAEVPAAIESYVAPAQNLLVADRDGGLLLTVLGRAPDRRAGDGRLPEPGWDPEYRWHGLLARAENPTVLQPADDLLVNANDDDRPPGYARPWSSDFDLPARAQRIRQLLLARRGWTAAELATVQTDTVSLFAREVVARIADRYEGQAARAYETLARWDGTMGTSGPSALFAVFERELSSAIFDDEAKRAGLAPLGSRARLLRLLRREMSEAWFDDAVARRHAERHEIVAAALARAWQLCAARWGPEPGRWSYGALHRLVLIHPLGRMPWIGRLLNRGPFPVPGSATTVAAWSGVWDGGAQLVAFGPSMRWISDTADPDRSLAAMPAGESGTPFDPHYADELEPFLRGALHPVAWSETAIERATVSRLRLEPAAAGGASR